jgi:hypothetical protein
MSDLFRFALSGDFRARIQRLWPRATPSDMAALDLLIEADRLIGDDGSPHDDFVAWVQAIIDRDGGAEPVPAVVPVKPRPAPAGALIGGVV